MLYVRFILGGFLLFLFSRAWSSHIRAGDLTIQAIGNANNILSYQITVMLYRDVMGVPPQPGTVNFGDGSPEVTVQPQSLGFSPDGMTEIVRYTVAHVYPSAGLYVVSYRELFRNDGTINMTNSGFTPFYLESIFRINPAIGFNNTPRMLIPPLDKGRTFLPFLHNPGAYDEEGDSLAYRLVPARQGRNQNVTNYRFPNEMSDSRADGTTPAVLTIDPRTGDILWDAPTQAGQYNLAFIIEEWRDGVLIGAVNRDMQILIEENPNRPPRLEIPRDTCVIAGKNVSGKAIAIDPDNDRMQLSANGALMTFVSPRNRATFSISLDIPGRIEGDFSWNSTCRDVRKEPYQVVFRAEDLPFNPARRLVDIKTWLITVIGPKPDTLIADTSQLSIKPQVNLSWNPYRCNNAVAMTIWRKKGTSDFTPSPCQTGLPTSLGFTKIGEVPISQTSFVDTFDLERGSRYCYRIFAIFPQITGGEGIASMEACVFIPTAAPYITNVSVLQTSSQEGKIFVRWTTPKDIDSTQILRPYTYQLVRIANGVRTVLPHVFQEKDTFFTDVNLNTAQIQYGYQLLFFANNVKIDSSAIATQVNPTLIASSSSIKITWDNFKVPWNNRTSSFPFHYVWRRRLDDTTQFDLIDSVQVLRNGLVYVDNGTFQNQKLQQKQKYCYYITLQGSYEYRKIPEPLLNDSRLGCILLLDTVQPCTPVLGQNTPFDVNPDAVLDCQLPPSSSFCLENKRYTNTLRWKKQLRSNSSTGCDAQEELSSLKFQIYKKLPLEPEYKLIAETTDTIFEDKDLFSVAACYQIRAKDGDGNMSVPTDPICVENCPYFELPNVFSPNGDGKNDEFTPFPCPRYVEKVNIVILNRWGEVVWQNENLVNIRWNGEYRNGGKVNDGTYLYECRIWYYDNWGVLQQQTRKGWIQVVGINNNVH
ncbi:MAG: gliding motility-associated C-terminal domain-containing protein [Cytophagales bacterium]|nr:gliding motility-associated C-terminal domain-containing protein [Cytophagales bacterium]MDW8385152.1 gliding motility-associated C-terminal domain-containing protein [Flammeovirgaceae bacterium]